MNFTEIIASFGVSCFLLGLVIGFFAKYFWDAYCNTIENGTENVICDEDEDEDD